GGLRLPPGAAPHDESCGDVETYRGRVAGVLEGEAAGPSTQLRIRSQGCADARICYPPQTRTVEVRLPARAGTAPAADAGFAALGQALGGGGAGAAPRLAGSDALPLPEAQAFGFEAIAGDGNTLLMRFTPAPGYYLYRDRSSFRVEGDGVRAGAPRWPRGVDHHDAHFGDVVVYFEPVDVPLPLRRSRPGAGEVVLTATFQGCQDEGICYPPMTRRVRVALPAGAVDAAPAGTAGALPGMPGDAGPDAGPDPAATGEGAASDLPPAPARAPASAAPPGPSRDAAADNDVRSTPPAARGGLALALLLALGGGLLLNVMPCVPPILSLQVPGLAQG